MELKKVSGPLSFRRELSRPWKELGFVAWRKLSAAEGFGRSRMPCAPALRGQSRPQTRRGPQAAGAPLTPAHQHLDKEVGTPRSGVPLAAPAGEDLSPQPAVPSQLTQA